MPPAAAERRMAEIEAALPDVRFAWNGRVDGSRSIYYRIQGPNLIIEFSTERLMLGWKEKSRHRA